MRPLSSQVLCPGLSSPSFYQAQPRPAPTPHTQPFDSAAPSCTTHPVLPLRFPSSTLYPAGLATRYATPSRLLARLPHPLGTSSSFLAFPVTNTIFFPAKEAAMVMPGDRADLPEALLPGVSALPTVPEGGGPASGRGSWEVQPPHPITLPGPRRQPPCFRDGKAAALSTQIACSVFPET